MAKAKEKESISVPALVVTPKTAPVVSGNFEQVQEYLQGWKKKILAVELTENNMEEVRIIKKEAQQYRNSLAKIQSDVKRLYFNDPKAVFDAQMAKLLAIVGEVEEAADAVLAKEEEERVLGIRVVLDDYCEQLQEQYKLTDEYLHRLEYRPSYYNKTTPKGYPSMDKFWRTDLEQQFQERKKEQVAYAANIRLIAATCADEPLLNTARYIRDLASSDVATIIEEINAEKRRLRGVGQPSTQTITSSSAAAEDADFEVVGGVERSAEEAKKLVLGVPGGINFRSDFPGRDKTIEIQISYPCDLGDALKELFDGLKPYGIKIKKIERQEAF